MRDSQLILIVSLLDRQFATWRSIEKEISDTGSVSKERYFGL